MHYKDRRRYEMVTRVRDFGATYGHLFPESTLAPQAFAAVATAAGEIETADVAETTASVAARATRKQDARQALLNQLVLIARTAQVLPEADPEFKSHFRVPNPKNDQLLLTTARQYVQHAEPVAAQFVAHGMPAAFPADVKALIDRFEGALRTRGMSRDQLVEARGRSKRALATALQAIDQIDVMVANHLTTDSVVSEVWKRARRIVASTKARRSSAAELVGAQEIAAPTPTLALVPDPTRTTA